MKYYIESNYALKVLESAFRFKYVHYNHDMIKDALTLKLRDKREYLKAYRNGKYNYLQYVDCGRQDAFGDKVDQLFRDYEALKIAYKLSKGDASLLKKYTDIITGE